MQTSKIHIGLLAADKTKEAMIKEILPQLGGGYVHHGSSMLELYQKLSAQKVQLLVYWTEGHESAADIQAILNFFRGKKDYASLPICILVNSEKLEMKSLLDPRIRAFPSSAGLFLALMSMQPLVVAADNVPVQMASVDWIQNEFLESLQQKVGGQSDFQVTSATEDELRTQFFGHHVDELRSHIGWFKYSARIIEKDGLTIEHIFPGMSSDERETAADNLMKMIIQDFKLKVYDDLHLKGAVFYPPVEELQPVDRKTIYSKSKSTGYTYTSKECCVILEVIQYI